jgi:hypothetical protein
MYRRGLLGRRLAVGWRRAADEFRDGHTLTGSARRAAQPMPGAIHVMVAVAQDAVGWSAAACFRVVRAWRAVALQTDLSSGKEGVAAI